MPADQASRGDIAVTAVLYSAVSLELTGNKQRAKESKRGNGRKVDATPTLFPKKKSIILFFFFSLALSWSIGSVSILRNKFNFRVQHIARYLALR